MTSAIHRSVRRTAALLLAAAMGVLAGCSSDPEQLAVEGSAKADKLTQCVAPTEFMRRNHMELIKHQRDETVHKGIRATDHRLASCIECHVRHDKQGNPVPVNAPGQFCADCHEYVGEDMNCYQCHSPVPNDPTTGAKSAAEGRVEEGRIAMSDVDLGVLHAVQQGKVN